MKFKNILIISVILLGTSVVMTSCNKYEDGPAFSLRSPVKRITGEWDLSAAKLNGKLVDMEDIGWLLTEIDTAYFEEWGVEPESVKISIAKATFEADGDGEFIFYMSAMTLPLSQKEYISWALDADKKNIIMNYNDTNIKFEILRLTKEEMNLKRTETINDTTTTYELEFTK
jgi:hypothetical protein